MTDISPASQRLLRELARRDKGAGVAVRYSGRGRWHLDGSSSTDFNRRTFPPLYEAGLALGWDEYDDDGPMRVTEAGRQLAAELESQAAEAAAAKKTRAKPSADGAAAQRLLREIAAQDGPVWIYNPNHARIWRVGTRDGYSATVNTWLALVRADRIRIERVSSIGGQQVSLTPAGVEFLGGAR